MYYFPISISTLSNSLLAWQGIFPFLTALVHIVFAAGVAKDIGHLLRRGIPTALVSGYFWILATALGGVPIAAIYWLIHHWNRASFTLKPSGDLRHAQSTHPNH